MKHPQTASALPPKIRTANRDPRGLLGGAMRHFQFSVFTLKFVLAAALLLAPLALPAQYSIDWWTVDGGGGTSSNGQYSLTGTIGQPDAGVMSGGGFTLVGGFWGIIGAIQTPGAPFLTVASTTTNTVVVSWPSPASGWTLEFTGALATAPAASTWTSISPPYQTGTTNIYYVEAFPIGNRFDRLTHP